MNVGLTCYSRSQSFHSMFPVPQSQCSLQALFSYYWTGTYIYWCACKWECFFRRRMEEIVGGGFVLFTSLRVCSATDNTSLDGNKKMCFCKTKLGIFCTANILCWNKYLLGDVSMRTSTTVLLKYYWESLSKCAGEHCRSLYMVIYLKISLFLFLKSFMQENEYVYHLSRQHKTCTSPQTPQPSSKRSNSEMGPPSHGQEGRQNQDLLGPRCWVCGWQVY